MAEGTPAAPGNTSQWSRSEHDSGYSTTPSPCSFSSLSPEFVTTIRQSPRKRTCISSSTPADQISCSLPKRLLSLSDIEDLSFEPSQDYLQDVFDDLELEELDEEVVQRKPKSEKKTFLLEDHESWGKVQRPRLTLKSRRPNYEGREKVDFLALLGEVNDFTPVLSNIFKYLSVKDLVNVSMVCKSWSRICKADRNAQTRLRKYLDRVRRNKENGEVHQLKKWKSSTNVLDFTPRRQFKELQNLNIGEKRHSISHPASSTSSPPVSPSKLRFHQFFRAAQSVTDGRTLAPCPRCSLPSLIDSTQKVGQCTREGCRYIFCCLCHCESHGTVPCRAPSLAPRSGRRFSSIGSKMSKRNLRRLC